MLLKDKIRHAIFNYVKDNKSIMQTTHASYHFVIIWTNPATSRNVFTNKNGALIATTVHNEYITKAAEVLLEMNITDQDTIKLYLEDPKTSNHEFAVEIDLSTTINVPIQQPTYREYETYMSYSTNKLPHSFLMEQVAPLEHKSLTPTAAASLPKNVVQPLTVPKSAPMPDLLQTAPPPKAATATIVKPLIPSLRTKPALSKSKLSVMFTIPEEIPPSTAAPATTHKTNLH